MEAGDAGIRLALAPYGKILDISYQRFSGFKQISTGTRIVRMSLEQHIPFQCNIQGYSCRIWYSGQPLKCTIVKGTHKAADCPDKNKCKRRHLTGHFAKDRKNVWGTTPQAHDASAPPRLVPTLLLPLPLHLPLFPPLVWWIPQLYPQWIQLLIMSPPLMSVNVPTPQEVDAMDDAGSGQGEAVSSQDTLFSDVEDSIGEFSQEAASSPAPSSSPFISSFPSSCSESILKDVVIDSSDPKLVVQISTIVSSNPMVVGQISNSVDNNINSSKNNSGNNNSGNNSNVAGPMKALTKSSNSSKEKTNLKGEKRPTPNKLVVSLVKLCRLLLVLIKLLIQTLVHLSMLLRLLIPKGLATLYLRALCECVLAPFWFLPLLEPIGECLRRRTIVRLDTLSLVQAPYLFHYGSVHNFS